MTSLFFLHSVKNTETLYKCRDIDCTKDNLKIDQNAQIQLIPKKWTKVKKY